MSGTLITFSAAFVASFAFIFLKAFQQLNVVYHKLWLVMPTSLAMAVCEVYVVHQIAVVGWGWIILPIGIGSGAGSLSAMLLHSYIRGKK